jgi:hypothetical protein
VLAARVLARLAGCLPLCFLALNFGLCVLCFVCVVCCLLVVSWWRGLCVVWCVVCAARGPAYRCRAG